RNVTGVQTCALPILGRRPIAAVDPDISSTVNIRTDLRPIRSPSIPKNAPPTGRRANATAKIAKVCSNATAPCDSGKNVLAMIVAIKPYTAKSNHSTTVPAKPANVTWRSIFGETSAVGDWFSMGVESLAFMKDSNVGKPGDIVIRSY